MVTEQWRTTNYLFPRFHNNHNAPLRYAHCRVKYHVRKHAIFHIVLNVNIIYNMKIWAFML